MRFNTTGAWLVLLSATLFGCSGGNDFADLRAFMDEVNARPKGRIEPLPPPASFTAFAYEASNLRSPFSPPVVIKRRNLDPSAPKVKPDLNRAKQYLEQYPIASLSMVGTLSREQQMFALIQDGDGGVHRVQVGDYMGTDFGQIQKIEEGSIELREIVSDGTDSWVERIRTVSLGGGDRG
ncbi:MAG: pilus assembly protein PilP [Pseudomonadales bacterium]